jgi:putative heme-binding domain-containing protein
MGGSEPTIADSALKLGLIFDDGNALTEMRRRATIRDVDVTRRKESIEALTQRRLPGFDRTLVTLLDDPDVASAAIRGLAEYDEPGIPAALIAVYPDLSPPARQDVLQTLASRREWASALLSAMANGVVPRADLSAYTARQILSLGDAGLTARLTQLWGEVRSSPADRIRRITELKRRLPANAVSTANPAAGRVLYRKLCANCHKLFDDGTQVGPDLTGSQRRNLDYLLENILDPSASVARDFQMEVIQTEAGRVITGLVVAESDAALTIATVNERVIVPVEEIELRQASKLSLMPDGLLQDLSITQVRDLVRYLSSDQQVPLP